MGHLALALSIIGAMLISAGAIGFFIVAAATAGIYALWILGGIALAFGMILFIAHLAMYRKQRRHMA